MLQKLKSTDRQIHGWLGSLVGTHSAPDLLLQLFAECDSIADLCILQSVLASLGEVRHYKVRAKLAVHTHVRMSNFIVL